MRWVRLQEINKYPEICVSFNEIGTIVCMYVCRVELRSDAETMKTSVETRSKYIVMVIPSSVWAFYEFLLYS